MKGPPRGTSPFRKAEQHRSRSPAQPRPAPQGAPSSAVPARFAWLSARCGPSAHTLPEGSCQAAPASVSATGRAAAIIPVLSHTAERLGGRDQCLTSARLCHRTATPAAPQPLLSARRGNPRRDEAKLRGPNPPRGTLPPPLPQREEFPGSRDDAPAAPGKHRHPETGGCHDKPLLPPALPPRHPPASAGTAPTPSSQPPRPERPHVSSRLATAAATRHKRGAGLARAAVARYKRSRRE